jgi:pseudouridine-5'-phosphate glycosidase
MSEKTRSWLSIDESVTRAIAERQPVVALESTVIAHGLPFPLNMETALSCERAVRDAGALPATIGLINGIARVGLSEGEIHQFAQASHEGGFVHKVNLGSLGFTLASKEPGATTVAATIKIAAAAGISVFSTGGIGGVHRGASQTFDISSDLTALATTPVICVCAGAKSLLDLPKTREFLETAGVPVIGFQTEEFPAFYSRESGLKVDARIDSPESVAHIARLHRGTGSQSALLVCVPVPAEAELPADEVERAVSMALISAEEKGIHGKAITPFVLGLLQEITNGRTLDANRALLVNCAATAARIATAL